MISFSQVTVRKNGREILSDISLSLDERRIGIIGRNGSGKTTFARLFNGLEKPSLGSIQFAGARNGADLRSEVGFVFQNPDNQIVYPIVEEDLAFGLRKRGLSKAVVEERIVSALAYFKIEHLRNCLTHQISGGERQLVALAGVLIMQPRLIVFDEPTTLLDLANKRQLMRTIANLQQHVVIVSHDLELLRDFDRVIYFEGGRIVGDGRPEGVIDEYIARSQ